MPRPRHAAQAAIAGLAAASLLLPFAPVYDAWAWLVWGREIVGLDLDTGAGPSWKPLPVIGTALLAPSASAAPDLWLFVARVGWLAAPVLAWRLASRLVFPARLSTSLAVGFAPDRVRRARMLAGAGAALGVVLLFDPFTAWARQFTGGLSEPLLVALVLGAIDRELAGRRGQALGLGAAAALLRPEVWPFLAIYGVYLWRTEGRLRGWLSVAALAVPILWLVPDLLGSGDPLTGAIRAREATGPPLGEAVEALGRALNLVLIGLWVAAVYAVATARRDGERTIVVLAGGALAWIGVVALLSAAGYAGLPRFSAPAGAVACVLGGIGVVRMVAAAEGLRDRGRRRAAWALVAALGLTLALQGGSRLAQVPAELRDAASYAGDLGDLRGLAEQLGPARVTGCGPVTTTEYLTETPLAWQLELPIPAVGLRLATAPPSGAFFVETDAPPVVRAAARGMGRRLGGRGIWEVFAIPCAGGVGSDQPLTQRLRLQFRYP